MTSHQLHALADQIARQERITHSQACAKLARRPRRSPSSKVKVKLTTVYWWQRSDL